MSYYSGNSLEKVLTSYLKAISFSAEQPHEVTQAVLLYVLPELIEQDDLTNILTCLMKFAEASDYKSFVLVTFASAYFHKQQTLAGNHRTLIDDRIHYNKLINHPKSTKQEINDAQAELEIIETAQEILNKIKPLTFFPDGEHKISTDINKLIRAAIPAELKLVDDIVTQIKETISIEVGEIKGQIQELPYRTHKDEPTQLLLKLEKTGDAFLNNKLHINEFARKLQEYLAKANTFPHSNMFFQAIKIFGVMTDLARSIFRIHVAISNAVVKLDQGLEELQNEYYKLSEQVLVNSPQRRP
ncbi:MAG: hypothetical protein V4501_04320 [Pseudomonadota bacterium]